MSIFGSSLIPVKDDENFCTNKEGHAPTLNGVSYIRNIASYNAKIDGRVAEEDSFSPLNVSSS